MASTNRDSFSCWDGFDVIFEKAVPSTPPLLSSSEREHKRHVEPRCLHSRQNSSEDSVGPATPSERDFESLNLVWDTIRQKKERQMARSPPKVQSLGVPASSPSPPTIASPPKPMQHRLKRRKSNVTFRESHDARMMTATFDLPGIKKPQVHVSFRDHNIIVDWETSKVTEKEEDGRIVRERKEERFTRTIPLPKGAKFEEVQASMDGRHLILTYPNMRSIRVEPRRIDTS